MAFRLFCAILMISEELKSKKMYALKFLKHINDSQLIFSSQATLFIMDFQGILTFFKAFQGFSFSLRVFRVFIFS